MSLSGIFLMLFLLVHLFLNSFLMFDSSGDLFNMGAHFMGTNPLMKIMEPILGLGFIVHILWSAWITLENRKATPVKYAVVDQKNASTWASRNMFVLGSVIFIFLVMHMMHFWYEIKITHSLIQVEVDKVMMENAYALVSGLFTHGTFGLVYSGLYILGAVALGLHLHHAFWSALQTLGWSNIVWRKRLTVFGDIYAIIIAGGFSLIPIYFIINF
jgi:succinate dehydrogenase / fumarate reductase cytochrome b subunit